MSLNHPDGTPQKSPKRYDLVESFDAMALSGGQRDPSARPNDIVIRRKIPSKESGFVGGFSPRLNVAGGGPAYTTPKGWKSPPFRRSSSSNDEPSRPFTFSTAILSPSPLPKTPEISVPNGQQQSLTMQYALRTPTRPGLMPPSGSNIPFSRPQSDSALLPPPPITSASPKPGLDVTPKRRRAASSPPSPSTTPSKSGTVQCSGVTKAGRQCARQVKAAPALSNVHPDAQIERFCHQHSKELLQVPGFYSHRVANEYISFLGTL